MNCVYKIVCKDPSITEFYIGSTNNLDRRIIEHESICNNFNNPKSNLKVYKFIRENGGFANWDIIVEQETPNYDIKNRFITEQSYKDKLKPQLNSNNAFGTDRNKNNKKYRESAKGKVYSKAYRDNNKEYLASLLQKWRDNNKDKLKNINKKWSDKKYICNICNKSLSISNKSRHNKKCISFNII